MADEKQDDSRSRAQIEKDVAAARARLANNVSALIGEAHPKVVAQRRLEQAKTFVNREVSDAKRQVKDENGWRKDRLAILGGAVAGLITFIAVVSAIAKKAKKDK